MYLMYLIALVPVIAGAILWATNKKIVWFEWLIGCAVAFAISGLTHLVVVHGMTSDDEIWSGTVVEVNHTPEWRAEWTETETYTDSDGDTHTRTVTKSRNYDPRWWVETNIGDFDIDESKYSELLRKFGEQRSRPGHRPDYDSGDRNDYFLVNKNNWIEPVTDMRSWTNRVKASPSVFSFPTVPSDVNVYTYPLVEDRFVSDRLFGRANLINNLQFDRMCAALGPVKKVNVIIIGFPEDSSSDIAQMQEAAWIGGKKNDLVICFGGGQGRKAGWAYVFGWTEEELVKRNLETIFLHNEINNDILQLVSREIIKNYTIKDWSKFDYLSIEPPTSAYIWLIVIMIISQTGLWIYFHMNEADKENCGLQTLFQNNKRSYYRKWGNR